MMNVDLTLNEVLAGINLLEAWDDECSGFASSVLSTSKNVATSKNDRNRLFLNGGWLLKALLENSHKKFSLQIIVFKFVAFGRRYILKLLHET
jgi:hypothetical protein